MIYFMLHGFASATPNENSAFFAKNFPDDLVVNLNYSFDPAEAERQLIDQVSSAIEESGDSEFCFVGCSLGGFFAQWLAATFSGKAICINPAVIPYEDLTRFLGMNTNYRTGKEFELRMEHVAGLARFVIPPGIVPTLVLLDMGDEVLDSAYTVEHFAGKAAIQTFEGGSHRFEHRDEALDAIHGFINTLV